LGNGFQEFIYQRALSWELKEKGLDFAREIEQDIFYKDLSEPIGRRRADFVVEGKVLVELKAMIQFEDVHLAQVLNYLKAYKLEVGLLINFGSKSLTYKRLGTVSTISVLQVYYKYHNKTVKSHNPLNP
jgi:GxxExxY protein